MLHPLVLLEYRFVTIIEKQHVLPQEEGIREKQNVLIALNSSQTQGFRKIHDIQALVSGFLTPRRIF